MSNVIALPLPIKPDHAEWRRQRQAEFRAHDARLRPTPEELRAARQAKQRAALQLRPPYLDPNCPKPAA